MGGLGAAFAGIMARMGLKSRPTDGSITSGSSGISVSRRMAMAESGVDVTPLDGGVAPSFIEIPHERASARSYPVDASIVNADQGVEVEGPYRPSSSYASDSNKYEL